MFNSQNIAKDSVNFIARDLHRIHSQLRSIEGEQIKALKEQVRLAEKAYRLRWAGDLKGAQACAEKLQEIAARHQTIGEAHAALSAELIRLNEMLNA